MTQERSVNIFLEGASCSGKTRLLSTITDRDIAIILKDWGSNPQNVGKPPLQFFLERDEDKLRRAKEAPEKTRLVDRSYLSTLTFYKVLEEQTGVSAEPVYTWFINEMGKKLWRPDHYVFVDVPAEVTLDRAKTAGRIFADNNMWFKHPDRIDYWYKQHLAVFEPATSIYCIDGSRNPAIVAEEFNDILSSLKKGAIR